MSVVSVGIFSPIVSGLSSQRWTKRFVLSRCCPVKVQKAHYHRHKPVVKEPDDHLTPEYKEKRRLRDHTLRTSTDDALIAVVNNTKTTQTAKQKHNLSDTTTKLMGRALAAAALMSCWFKGEERIHLDFHGDGSGLNALVVEAMRTGELRGYVSQPQFYLPVTAPIGYALRAGSLTSYKTLYDHAKPMQSTTPLAACDIASDVELHYQLSDQIPTIIDLDTVLSPSGDVVFSGGIFVQALPPKGDQKETQQEVIERYRQHLRSLPPLSTLFKEDTHSLRQVLERIAPGKIQQESITKIPTDFHCRCSKDQFKKALIAVGPKELDSLLSLPEEERDTLKCYYCAKEYALDQKDVDDLRKAVGLQGP